MMNSRIKFVVLTGVLALLVMQPIKAQSDPSFEDLAQLRWEVSASCPARWEDLEGYVDHLLSRLIYTLEENDTNVDVFAYNSGDKAEYIKWAIRNFSTSDTSVGSVLQSCFLTRSVYFNVINDKHHADIGSLDKTRWRDDDDDNVVDLYDQCDFQSLDESGLNVLPNPTPNGEIADGEGLWIGCSASQRDTDFDGVSDAIDLCADTPQSVIDAQLVSATDGCTDTDQDGESNRTDPYPFQNDTQCIGGNQ